MCAIQDELDHFEETFAFSCQKGHSTDILYYRIFLSISNAIIYVPEHWWTCQV